MASLVMMVMVITPAVISFNLEPRIAIVKRGPPGSYFGYSVAEHQVVERSSLRSVALVGAPRDNSSQPGTTRSVQTGGNKRTEATNRVGVAELCLKFDSIRLQFNFHLWRYNHNIVSGLEVTSALQLRTWQQNYNLH